MRDAKIREKDRMRQAKWRSENKAKFAKASRRANLRKQYTEFLLSFSNS